MCEHIRRIGMIVEVGHIAITGFIEEIQLRGKRFQPIAECCHTHGATQRHGAAGRNLLSSLEDIGVIAVHTLCNALLLLHTDNTQVAATMFYLGPQLVQPIAHILAFLGKGIVLACIVEQIHYPAIIPIADEIT